MKKKILFVLCLLPLIHCLNAQDSTKTASKWRFSAGLTVITVPTYHIVGTDTGFANTLSLAPSISISNSSGLAVSYSPKMILGGSNPGIYMHAVSLGYSQYGKPLFDFAVNYAHFFFTNNNSVPYTPLDNEIYTELSYKKTWLRPKIAAGLGFGTNKATATTPSSSAYDIGVAAGIGHSFDWDKDNVSFSLAPSILLNAGTNQYFSFLNISKYIGHSNKFGNYTKSGPGSKGGNGRGRGGSSGSGGSGTGGTTTTTTTTTTGETFNLTNVECNLESSIDIGSSFTIRPTASIFIPVGSAVVSDVTAFWQLVFQYKF